MLDKYNKLLCENDQLKEENKRLIAQLGATNTNSINADISKSKAEQIIINDELINNAISPSPEINKKSNSTAKIKLFLLLFKGRDDVYANLLSVS